MELLAALIGGILAVIGAFSGVWLANRYQSRAQKQQTQRDTTVALYTELTSVEMLTSRMKASKLLDQVLHKEGKLTISELASNVDADFDDWYHVGRVLTFFQKLGLYLQVGYLNEDLAYQLMGDVTELWYDHYLSHLVQDVDLGLVGCNAELISGSLAAWLARNRTEEPAAGQRACGDGA